MNSRKNKKFFWGGKGVVKKVLGNVRISWQNIQYTLMLCHVYLDQPSELVRKVTDPISECVLSSFRRYYEYYEDTARPGRLGKILLSSLYIHSCPADQLEQLFFSGIIGSVNIDSVIPYILSMDIPAQCTNTHNIKEEEEEEEAEAEEESETESHSQSSHLNTDNYQE